MRLINALASFWLTLSLLSATSQKAPEAALTQGAEARQPSLDFYDVQEMPLTISDVTLDHAGGGRVLKCTAANRSPERLLGARFIILMVDRFGKLRRRVGWTERIALEGYSTKSFSLRLPTKLRAAAEGRTVLAVEQVIGRESIWMVVNAKEAFAAYASDSVFVVPDVRRISNQGDFFPGIGVLPE